MNKKKIKKNYKKVHAVYFAFFRKIEFYEVIRFNILKVIAKCYR